LKRPLKPPFGHSSWALTAGGGQPPRGGDTIKQKKVEPFEAGEPRRRRPRSLYHRVAPGVV